MLAAKAPTIVAATVSRAGPTAYWYLSRGTGVVSLMLLTGSVVLGILESFRWTPRGWPRFSIAVLHRDISLVALAFIGAHIVTVVLDGFAPIRWGDAVLPFLSAYRPFWLGLGALSFDLLLAVTVTSLLRRHVGYRLWRAVHWLAYASWPVALVHGLGTGTDTRVQWILGLNAACAALVIALLLRRLTIGWPHRVPGRILAGTVTAIAPVLVGAWVVLGPLQPGWAKVAGTPPSLLAASATRVPTSTGGPQPSAQPSAVPTFLFKPFQGTLGGTIRQTADEGDGLAVVVIRTTLSGQTSGSLEIVLRGQPLDTGGVSVSSSQALFAINSGPTYRGSVSQINGDYVVVLLRSRRHPELEIAIQLRFDRVPGPLTGVAQGRFAGGGG
jgi:sulfoxide reductase heme-binding subunit YedZ